MLQLLHRALKVLFRLLRKDYQCRCRAGSQNCKGDFKKEAKLHKAHENSVLPPVHSQGSQVIEKLPDGGEKPSSAWQDMANNLRRADCTKPLGRSGFPVGVITLPNQWERVYCIICSSITAQRGGGDLAGKLPPGRRTGFEIVKWRTSALFSRL